MNTRTIAIQRFLTSEEAHTVHKELLAMVDNPRYKTEDSYSPSSAEPVSFVDKHMKYLSTHQKLNHQHYLSNLKLMTKVQ